jgi:hypothetical protein
MSLRVNRIATLIDFGLSTVVYEQEQIGYTEKPVKDRHSRDLRDLHRMFSDYYRRLRDRFSSPSILNEVRLKRFKSLMDLESSIEGEGTAYIQSFYSIVKEFN